MKSGITANLYETVQVLSGYKAERIGYKINNKGQLKKETPERMSTLSSDIPLPDFSAQKRILTCLNDSEMEDDVDPGIYFLVTMSNNILSIEDDNKYEIIKGVKNVDSKGKVNKYDFPIDKVLDTFDDRIDAIHPYNSDPALMNDFIKQFWTESV